MVSFLFFSGYFFSSDILFFLTCFLYKVCVLYATIKKPGLGLFVFRPLFPVYRPPSIVLRPS